MSQSLLFLFHALSPVHAGTGQGVGAIDLPIARERVTEFPIIPGSSLKGVLRSQCADKDVQKALFGPDTEGASEHAGSVHLGDLQILLFPVRSLRGVFAYATCPLVLNRFQRDLTVLGQKGWKVPDIKQESECLVSNDSVLISEQRLLYLEELDFTGAISSELDSWAAYIAKSAGIPEAHLKGRICLVHDDVFAYFSTTATDIRARIRLQEDTKTVQRGALWYEESLPAEAILWSVGLVDPVPSVRDKKAEWDASGLTRQLKQLSERPLQLGGKSTVGRGFGRLSVVEG